MNDANALAIHPEVEAAKKLAQLTGYAYAVVRTPVGTIVAMQAWKASKAGRHQIIEVFSDRAKVPAAWSFCFYCGECATTWDHVVPRCRGGNDLPSNRVRACYACNQDKADLSLEAYRRKVSRECGGKEIGGRFWLFAFAGE